MNDQQKHLYYIKYIKLLDYSSKFCEL